MYAPPPGYRPQQFQPRLTCAVADLELSSDRRQCVFEYIYIGMFRIYIAQKEFSFSIFKKSIPGLINNRAPTRSDGVSRLAALLALPPLLL